MAEMNLSLNDRGKGRLSPLPNAFAFGASKFPPFSPGGPGPGGPRGLTYRRRTRDLFTPGKRQIHQMRPADILPTIHSTILNGIRNPRPAPFRFPYSLS